MKKIVFAVSLFGKVEHRKQDERSMGRCLDLLVDLNCDFYRKCGYRPPSPGVRAVVPRRMRDRIVPLYQSGVVYALDPPGIELFQTTPDLYEAGEGDCEDLAAARVAELRMRLGEPAKIGYRGRRLENGHLLFHILVVRGDGRIEDPSRELGMGRQAVLE